MRDERDEWLAGLAVGDAVIEEHRGAFETERLRPTVVSRLTKTQIVTALGARFRRSDGHEPGDGYHRPCLRQPTPELLEEVQRRDLGAQIRRAVEGITTDKSIPLDVLRDIRRAVEPIIVARRAAKTGTST